VEEKPDVTYSDVGGCKEQIEKLREVVETPLLHPERFVNLGIGKCFFMIHSCTKIAEPVDFLEALSLMPA
jgi:SpoVK/Ycf46/Vps4 family AAA+-type ATPase